MKTLLKNKKAQGPDVLIGFLLVAVLGLGGTFFLSTFVSSLSLTGLISVLDSEQEQACVFMMLPLMGNDYIREGYSITDMNKLSSPTQYVKLRNYFGESEYETFSKDYDTTINDFNNFVNTPDDVLYGSYHYSGCVDDGTCMKLPFVAFKGQNTDSFVVIGNSFIPSRSGKVHDVYIAGEVNDTATFNDYIYLGIYHECGAAGVKEGKCSTASEPYPDPIIKRKITADELIEQSGGWIRVNVGNSYNYQFEKGETYYIFIAADADLTYNPFHWYRDQGKNLEVSSGAGDQLFIHPYNYEINSETDYSFYYKINMTSGPNDYEYSPIQVDKVQGYMASRAKASELKTSDEGKVRYNAFGYNHACTLTVYSPYMDYGIAQLYVLTSGN